MRVVYADITEFISNPIRTGVQRVVRAVLTRWPNNSLLVPVRFDPSIGALRRIDPMALNRAVCFTRNDRERLEDLQRELCFLDGAASKPIQVNPNDAILVPEIFFESRRVCFYRKLIHSVKNVGFIVPDFLVWLRPDTFPIKSTAPLMMYLLLLLESNKRAFISESVRETFEERMLRAPSGPSDVVLDLGADGPNFSRQTYRNDRHILLFLGTMDGRKGQQIAYEAFAHGRVSPSSKLVFVGRVPDDYAPSLDKVLQNSRTDVDVIREASDEQISNLLHNTRAMVYLSPAEGYGLPPMESLFAGVPVLVHKNLPALRGKSLSGQIRLDDLELRTVASAFRAVEQDQFAERLWTEAAGFRGVTWDMFANTVSNWINT